MAVPQEIVDLVERFERDRDVYQSDKYNEAQLRKEFIDPFFKALGWDMDNTKGYAPAYREVIHEDAIKVGGFTKAPDYCFRIGGSRKFFLEAKKPSVNLKEDINPAFQLRRYAWSAKLPLSILTDFEEFAVYDCRIKPIKNDKSSNARTIYMKFDKYIDRWDEITSIFAREAILKGSFDRYVETAGKKRGTAEVDAAFLKEIESWREMLAKNIALRNPALTTRELNYAVQQTIDRIIFLRICEDRGIEEYGKLLSNLNGNQVYRRLIKLFHDADARYNSGLFHFEKEKDRPEDLDELTLKLNIDDKPLKAIIKDLYYPDSPYEFSVLPADILGQVYEQFLGKVIRLTPGHHAVIDDKPEVKKAGGVYYTPTYIVDYIVKNTVGKLLEDKKPIQAAKLKILDPACGSGSFLIGAYQYLLDWHRNWYVDDNLKKYAKKGILYEGRGGDWRLSTSEKKRILLNNIYGVDIDSQAVEVTKLSLLLKVLEDETQLSLFKERALPDLGNNIKCGNSLIGPDFYEGQQIGMFDEEERYRINAFDWKEEFPEIMKSGGFDAVIGNPPYVRQETLGDLKQYFQQHYQVYHGMADLYAYFIERGVSLLKKGGLFGFIVSNKWMRANYGVPLRNWMKEQHIEKIVDFGDLPVFQKATTYPCILLLSKDSAHNTFEATQVESLSFYSLDNYVTENHYAINKSALDSGGWSLVDEKTQALLDRLRSTGVSLGNYLEGKIYRGILSGLDKAFVIDESTKEKLIKEDQKSIELVKPYLTGRDIKRYNSQRSNKYIILVPSGWTLKNKPHSKDAWNWFLESYPAIANHLTPYANDAKKRFDKGDFWWELRSCDYYKEFEKPKILYLKFQVKPAFTFYDDVYYPNSAVFAIPNSDMFLLGILNSKLGWFLISNCCTQIQNGYQLIYKYLKNIPICYISSSDQANKAHRNNTIKLVEQALKLHKQLASAKTPVEKTTIQRQIDATDYQIDQLVYELYGLKEEEIKIVEKSTRR